MNFRLYSNVISIRKLIIISFIIIIIIQNRTTNHSTSFFYTVLFSPYVPERLLKKKKTYNTAQPSTSKISTLIDSLLTLNQRKKPIPTVCSAYQNKPFQRPFGFFRRCGAACMCLSNNFTWTYNVYKQ